MPIRRYLTFSLRTLFVLLTASAVWLGVVVNRAREQREAVEAIEALGGVVYYDWQIYYAPEQPTEPRFHRDAGPSGARWLRAVVGDEFFQQVELVAFKTDPVLLSAEKIVASIPQLQRLPRLRRVEIDWSALRTRHQLEVAIPNCEIRPTFFR